MASAETAQSPLGREELNDLMDYGNERMTNSHCSLDPFRREIRVTALTDDKVLLMTSCESGAYNTVWLAAGLPPAPLCRPSGAANVAIPAAGRGAA